MKKIKIISGGQTGADRAALEIARELGFETGGIAPAGYMTEDGPDISLKDFGLVPHRSASPPARTKANVLMADVTIWFGKIGSRGFQCTRNAAKKFTKPFYSNPDVTVLIKLLHENKIINIAGNRASHNPGIYQYVRRYLGLALKEIAKTNAEV